MPKLSDAALKKRNDIMEQMKALNNKGMFPKGYGNIVLEMANDILAKEGKKLTTLSRVNAVAVGGGYHPIIVDCLLEIAKENKLENQLALAKALLG